MSAPNNQEVFISHHSNSSNAAHADDDEDIEVVSFTHPLEIDLSFRGTPPASPLSVSPNTASPNTSSSARTSFRKRRVLGSRNAGQFPFRTKSLDENYARQLQVVPSPLVSNNDAWNNNSANESPYSSTSLANNSSIGQLYRINEITPGGQHEGSGPSGSTGNGSGGYYRDSLDAGPSMGIQHQIGRQDSGNNHSSPGSGPDPDGSRSPTGKPSPSSSAGTPTGTAAEKDMRLTMMQRRISSNAFGLNSQVPTPSSSQQNLTVRTPPLAQRKQPAPAGAGAPARTHPAPFLRGKSIGHFHSEKSHRRVLGE
ncbi:hypothetical protein BV898_13564 [Hypsibius exemplaris]|uniref:Uncharacterized protein n=1 Tax=Hypsibius exemplaris TaxID=2072580 RepID=A0A1W0WAF0_HYPEX|nr:hypothetical protein BV898_13564 [Hypsibius exemplaris]